MFRRTKISSTRLSKSGPDAGNALTRSASKNEPMVQFLAFGMSINNSLARDYLDDLEAMRVDWTLGHGRDELDDEDLLGLLGEVTRDCLEPHTSLPVTLGISGGFDSRPLFHVLASQGHAVDLFTFGSPGNIDFDLLRAVSPRLSLDIQWIDTNKQEWSLAAFDEHARLSNNLPLSPATLARQVMKDRHPRRVEPYGYPNGVLTGGARPPSKKYTGMSDLAVFMKMNDPFGLQQHLPPKIVSAAFQGHAATDQRGFSVYQQLNLGYRQRQRIMPISTPTVTYALPYADPRWVGYWLNRDYSQLAHQRSWSRFLSRIDSPLFLDIAGIEEEQWGFNRARLARIYGDGSATGLAPRVDPRLVKQNNPKNHFSYFACYANNPSFRVMISESITRLTDRNIFDQRFIQSVWDDFLAADADAELALHGLVSADIAAEAGRF